MCLAECIVSTGIKSRPVRWRRALTDGSDADADSGWKARSLSSQPRARPAHPPCSSLRALLWFEPNQCNCFSVSAREASNSGEPHWLWVFWAWGHLKALSLPEALWFLQVKGAERLGRSLSLTCVKAPPASLLSEPFFDFSSHDSQETNFVSSDCVF